MRSSGFEWYRFLTNYISIIVFVVVIPEQTFACSNGAEAHLAAPEPHSMGASSSTVYVRAAVMQASSEALGTALVLQLPGVNQFPPAVFVHESVHPLAPAPASTRAVRARIATTAITIVRARPHARLKARAVPPPRARPQANPRHFGGQSVLYALYAVAT